MSEGAEEPLELLKENVDAEKKVTGTAKVLVNNKPAACVGDQAMTCNDPADAPQGVVVGGATVLYGS